MVINNKVLFKIVRLLKKINELTRYSFCIKNNNNKVIYHPPLIAFNKIVPAIPKPAPETNKFHLKCSPLINLV